MSAKKAKNKGYVAYYRVSTKEQGKSGLGIEAQKTAVANYLNEHEFDLISEHAEIISGKKKNRPELNKALKECKKHGATLIVAKLDRLSRNVHFISGLIDARYNFVVADMPNYDKFFIHMGAVIAEKERDMIAARTKQSLEEAKKRGVKLGANGKKLAEANKAKADKFAEQLKPVISDLRTAGIRSVRAITDELNKRNIPTSTGGCWHIATVHNLLHRIDGKRTRRNVRKMNMKAQSLELKPVIRSLRKAGVSSLRGTANALNEKGIQSFRGGRWHPNTVQALFERIGMKSLSK